MRFSHSSSLHKHLDWHFVTNLELKERKYCTRDTLCTTDVSIALIQSSKKLIYHIFPLLIFNFNYYYRVGSRELVSKMLLQKQVKKKKRNISLRTMSQAQKRNSIASLVVKPLKMFGIKNRKHGY